MEQRQAKVEEHPIDLVFLKKKKLSETKKKAYIRCLRTERDGC